MTNIERIVRKAFADRLVDISDGAAILAAVEMLTIELDKEQHSLVAKMLVNRYGYQIIEGIKRLNCEVE